MGSSIEHANFVNSVILQTCPPGKYLGREAQVRLNRIAESAHATILTRCREHFEIDLLTHFYDMFDEACYHVLSGKYWIMQNANLIRNLEVAPSVFSYLINAVLFSKSKSSKKPEKTELDSIAELAFLLIRICNYSDFLFYTGFDDGFEISEAGDLNLVQSDKTRHLQDRAMQKIGERRLTMHSKELWGETKSFRELSKPYDSVFRQKYGIELSEVSEIIAHGIQHNVKKPKGAIISSYGELTKRLRKGLKLSRSTVERAVSLFELDREMLHVDWRYYKLYDMRPGPSRQPIVHISGKVGKDGAIIYGPNALLRAVALLFADLDRGIVDLGEFSQHHLKQKGLGFERKVRELFDRYGFNTLHITDTPSNVGEIDCVAYNNVRGILFVIEAKSPKIDLSLKEAKWQIKNTQKWCLQLFKKSEWVRANLEHVAEMLRISPDNIKEVKDIVVEEVPTFCDIDCSSKIVTIEDLYYILEAMRA